MKLIDVHSEQAGFQPCREIAIVLLTQVARVGHPLSFATCQCRMSQFDRMSFSQLRNSVYYGGNRTLIRVKELYDL